MFVMFQTGGYVGYGTGSRSCGGRDTACSISIACIAMSRLLGRLAMTVTAAISRSSVCAKLDTSLDLHRLENRAINALNACAQGLVGKEDDWHLITLGHIKGHKDQAVAIRHVRRCDDHARRISMARIESEAQVGLLHLRWHTCAGASALRIHKHCRYLCHRCIADQFCHERETRTRGSRHSTYTTERGSQD